MVIRQYFYDLILLAGIRSNNQRHRNRNSRTSHRTTNSSSANENNSENNNINELDITCLLYPAFDNHQKYYLSSSTTEQELKEKAETSTSI